MKNLAKHPALALILLFIISGVAYEITKISFIKQIPFIITVFLGGVIGSLSANAIKKNKKIPEQTQKSLVVLLGVNVVNLPLTFVNISLIPVSTIFWTIILFFITFRLIIITSLLQPKHWFEEVFKKLLPYSLIQFIGVNIIFLVL